MREANYAEDVRVFGIHIEIKEQANIVEESVGGKMHFIQYKNGGHFLVFVQSKYGSLDLREHIHLFAFGDFSETIEEASVKVIGRYCRELEIDDFVKGSVEIAGKSADDGGFSASRFPSDEPDPPGLFEMLHSGQPFYEGS
jgi:hypothetical protein